MTLIKKGTGLVVLALLFSISAHSQFLSTDGKKIVNDEGEEIIFRGYGLGGWMLQEGYMLQTSGPQHVLEQRIENLVGIEKKREFYDRWLSNFTTRKDIELMAEAGFNMIRLPMHYKLYTLPIEEEANSNTWLEKGFAMTDSLVQWCKDNGMYLILDLHAAPGGQGENEDISDYDRTKPSLWESEANQAKTIALWKKIAERYASEPTVVAYDLINEPNWGFQNHANDLNGCGESSNEPLWKLQENITKAIREVDDNHIIVIEGNCWGGNYNGLPDLWDDNIVISYHKYWNHNDQGSIQGMLNMRNSRNVPIWLGETGENSNTWFANSVRLFETNNIGWAWWPHKKVGLNTLLEVASPKGYDEILRYWNDGGSKPGAEAAWETLSTLTENLKVENAIYHKDVSDALIRQPFSNETKVFTKRKLNTTEELIISATDFDLGRNGYAYYDTDTANYHGSTGTYTAWNAGWGYRNDGVDIEKSQDADELSNGYNIGWTASDEWMQYTTEVETTGAYRLKLRYAGEGASAFKIAIGERVITESYELESTGGYQQWKTYEATDPVLLQAGNQPVRLVIDQGGMNIGYFGIAYVGGEETLPFNIVNGYTVNDKTIVLNLNQPAHDDSQIVVEDFKVSIDNQIVNISTITIDDFDIMINLEATIQDGEEIVVSYMGSTILNSSEVSLGVTEGITIDNRLAKHYAIPGRLQAEDFVENQGLELETTADAGGGLNIGYTNTGDFLTYRINVAETGDYYIDVRIACESNPGKILLEQMSYDGEVLGEVEVDVPVTGGWQVWQTVRKRITLQAGRGLLKLTILDPEFNVNWLQFNTAPILGIENSRLNVFPNPTSGEITLPLSASGSVKLFNTQGKLIQKWNLNHSNKVVFTGIKEGVYLLAYQSKGVLQTERIIVK
ncbi:MAG: carbohydrate-binding protein [Cyclobacteriaceae bacterium]